jgi:hypothetical protein
MIVGWKARVDPPADRNQKDRDEEILKKNSRSMKTAKGRMCDERHAGRAGIEEKEGPERKRARRLVLFTTPPASPATPAVPA